MPYNPPNFQGLAANPRRPGIEARSASADAEGRFTVDCYRGFVDRRTRILAVSWVVCGNGYRADLAELSSFCRERGIKLIVDGIQAVRVLAAPVSELGADVVIAGGHEARAGRPGRQGGNHSSRVRVMGRPGQFSMNDSEILTI